MKAVSPIEHEEKDIRATLTLRNNRVLTLREQRGWSQQELAHQAGISLNRVGEIERFGSNVYLSRRPVAYRQLRFGIVAIARCFNVSPEEVLSEGMYEIFARVPVTLERRVQIRDLPALMNYHQQLIEQRGTDAETQIFAKEVISTLVGYVQLLDPREEAVIYMRFGLNGGEIATWQEIAERWAFTKERGRQIVKTAMLRLIRKFASHNRVQNTPIEAEDLPGWQNLIRFLFSVVLTNNNILSPEFGSQRRQEITWWLQDEESLCGGPHLCEVINIQVSHVQARWYRRMQQRKEEENVDNDLSANP